MTEVSTAVQVINTVGFPIACCIGLGWLHFNTQKANNATMLQMNSTIANNTLALTKLTEKIDGGRV